MKALVQIATVVIVGVVIAFAHPFGLAMPWQGGSAVPVTDAVLEIVSSHDFEIESLDWGRSHPFTFVSADGEFVGNGHPAATCSELRSSLATWGRVTNTDRRSDGCDIEAIRGTLRADAQLRTDQDEPGRLLIEVVVRHTD